MPSFPGFIGGSAPSQSVIATSERTVKFHLEKITRWYPPQYVPVAFIGAAICFTVSLLSFL